jgi:hypothetical protein
MPKIKIKRTKEYNNMLRDFIILIDGQEIGKIANGETKDFEILPGHHIIKAKIDWGSSPEIPIVLVDNEIKNLKVGGFKYGKWLIPITFITLLIHSVILATAGVNGIIFLAITTFLLLVYYLTFGRNKYLTLTETNIN